MFAPTTTIQRQWREKVELFGGDAPWIARHVSLDARDLIERIAALAHEWRRFVGGGRLIYTRTLEGRRILLQARAQRREPLPQMGFQVWR